MRFLLAVIVPTLSLITACGDGGDERDFVRVTGASVGQFDEQDSADGPFGHDPEVFGQQETTIEGIEVGMWSGYTGDGRADGFSEYLFLNFKRTLEPSSARIDDDTLSVLYRNSDELYVANAFNGASGTAALTAVADVGGEIEGEFDVTLCQSEDGANFPDDCTFGTRQMSGSFRATRERTGTAGRGKE